jgi:hypothetical protein
MVEMHEPGHPRAGSREDTRCCILQTLLGNFRHKPHHVKTKTFPVHVLVKLSRGVIGAVSASQGRLFTNHSAAAM